MITPKMVGRLRERFAVWRSVTRLALTAQERMDIENEVEAIIAGIERYREALEYISRISGKNEAGMIDWQRALDRAQAVARTALAGEKNDG